MNLAKLPLYVGSITSPLDVFIKYVHVELLYYFTLALPFSLLVENT